MSALTDLFTALANKIRSKTGGSATYTPPQMVAAIDDVYDAGVAAGTTPTQTKTVTAGTSATTVTPDQGYALSSVTVNPTPSETKTQVAGTSNIDVTPTSGKLLSKVTVTPQQHSDSYTPAANTSANDMGAVHNKRYVNTSGMIVPSGNKSITANGTGIDVSSYATASVNVPNPTLSGDATASDVLSGKTFYSDSYTKKTGTYTAPTITSITPSNTSPVSMSANNNYKPTASGYAISSYSSVTPSSSGASFSSGMVKMSSSGYAYSSRPASAPSLYNPNKQVHVSLAKNASTTVSVDQKPRYIIIHWALSGTSSTIVGGGEYDVNADRRAVVSWNGSSFNTNKDATGVLDIVPSVSSTSLTVANPSSNYTRHVCLDIYY